MLDGDNVETSAASLSGCAGLSIAWLQLTRLSRLAGLSTVLLRLLNGLIAILLRLALLPSLADLRFAFLDLRCLAVRLVLTRLLAQLWTLTGLSGLCWSLALARGAVERAGDLLQIVDKVRVVLDHHFGELFDFFVLRLFLYELRQFDFSLVIDKEPVCHDMRAATGWLLTWARLLGHARLAGLRLTRLDARLTR